MTSHILMVHVPNITIACSEQNVWDPSSVAGGHVRNYVGPI